MALFSTYQNLVLQYSTLLVSLNSSLSSSSSSSSDPVSPATTSLVEQCNATADEISTMSSLLLSTIGNGGGGGSNLFLQEMRRQIRKDQKHIAESQDQVKSIMDGYLKYGEQYNITLMHTEMESATYNVWKLIAFILVMVTAALMYTIFSTLEF